MQLLRVGTTDLRRAAAAETRRRSCRRRRRREKKKTIRDTNDDIQHPENNIHTQTQCCVCLCMLQNDTEHARTIEQNDGPREMWNVCRRVCDGEKKKRTLHTTTRRLRATYPRADCASTHTMSSTIVRHCPTPCRPCEYVLASCPRSFDHRWPASVRQRRHRCHCRCHCRRCQSRRLQQQQLQPPRPRYDTRSMKCTVWPTPIRRGWDERQRTIASWWFCVCVWGNCWSGYRIIDVKCNAQKTRRRWREKNVVKCANRKQHYQ